MFAVPAAIRESLVQAYKSGDIKTSADWWNIVREVATKTAQEAAVGAATMGAGSLAARTLGSALVPAIGQSIAVPTAMKAIGAADTAAQLATMVSMPAALQGRLPDAQEFMDAAIVIGGLHAAAPIAERITSVFQKTGRTPAEQVADAQADPKIAEELKSGPVPEEEIPDRWAKPTKQQELWSIQGRLDDLDRKANGTPETTVPGPDGTPVTIPAEQPNYLTPEEKVERDSLRVQATTLASEVAVSRETPTSAPRFSPEQLADASERAKTRLDELNTKVASEPLTDTERAERVSLANSLSNPEALARRMGMVPEIKVPTDAERTESANRVYEDILRQVHDNNNSRIAAGISPLGDNDYVTKISKLAAARIVTRANRTGILPWDLYAGKPLQVRDITQEDHQVALEDANPPPDAPTFTPPEVDLFGDPVQVNMAPREAVTNLQTQEIPLKDLKLSKEVPQFKQAANAEGVIVPLGGTFDRTGVGPIQVWERHDGSLEVISGRHRLDLARRSGEETIPAQIHREAEGFDARQAATLDAQLNIREEQGSVADYAQYFKDAGITKEAADKQGLLARAKGRTGYAIARDASPDVLEAHRTGRLSDEAALAISSTAPGSERLQALGIQLVNDGKSILIATNTMKAVDLMAAERMAAGEQGDIFGFDAGAMREAAAMAKKASSAQREISEQISAVSGASKRPELARKMGVDVQDPQGVQKKIAELKTEQYQWDNWPLYPDLVAKLRKADLAQTPLYQDDFELKPETPAEIKARDEEAAAAAVRKMAQERAGVRGPVYTVDQADLFNTQGTLFQSERDKPWYYSELAKQIDALPTARVPADGLTGEQWKKLIWEPETTKTVALRDEKNKPTGETKEVKVQGKSNLPGVKQEEIEATGITDWLDTQEGKVTKEQVSQFMQQGGVKIDEVMKGSGKQRTPQDPAIAADMSLLKDNGLYVDESPGGNLWGVTDLESGDIYTDVGEAKPEWWDGAKSSGQDIVRAIDHVVEYMNAPGTITPTKFSDYQLPGAKEGSYRELVLTLPPSIEYRPVLTGNQPVEVRRSGGGEGQGGYFLVDRSGEWGMQEFQTRADADAALEAVRNGQQAMAPYEVNDFESSHFPGFNYIAHTRVNDRDVPIANLAETMPDLAKRLEAEGKTNAKVLQVEEIQSDRAQKGRTEGFRKSWPESEIAKFTVSDKPIQGYWEVRDGEGNLLASPPPHLNATPAEALAVVQRGVRAGTLPGLGKISPAPFVTKTDSWTALVLKRLLRYAAEGNYDAIAWTRGDQQVERYSSALRSAVDAIEWKKTPEGVQITGYKRTNALKYDAGALFKAETAIRSNDLLGFDTITHARSALLSHRADWQTRWGDMSSEDKHTIQNWLDTVEYDRNKVVDTTEKESALSDAIGKSMADRIRNDPNQTGTIEGDNITVSDTGMAGFYDRIVPKVAQDVAKKVGGGKVGEMRIPTEAFVESHLLSPFEENRWRELNGMNNRGELANRSSRALLVELRELSEKRKGGGSLEDVTSPQQAIEITPAMREKIMAGQALFQNKAPGQEDAGGQHLASYNIAENLITTFERANKSSIVHELGHSWLEEMKADAARPDAPAQIKADWEILRKEFAIGESGDIPTASHEQFARTAERYLAEGQAPSIGLRAVFERFKSWMLEIYQHLNNIGSPINPEVKGVVDRMLATDQEIADAKEMNIPRAYVPEAKASLAEKIIPTTPEGRKIEPGFAAEQASMQPFADELPAGPGEAPNNSHVNYAYINSPMDVKLAMQKMSEIDQGNIQKQRGGTKGVKSWADANAEQAKYVNDILDGTKDTLQLLQPRDPNAAGPDVKLGILKKLAVGAAKDSARLRDVVLQAGHDATVKQQLEYMGSIERARMIQAEFLGERAGVARALNALKDVTEGSGEIGRMLDAIGYGEAAARELYQTARTPAEENAYLKAQLDIILQNYKGKTVLDIAKLHKEIGTLKGTFKMAKGMEKATTWEKVIEAWRAGLLSGPVTHTTNLFGTGAFQAMRTPVDALAAIIGMARGASPGMGETDRASMSEAVGRLTGWLGGVQDGLKVGYHSYMADQTSGKTESFRESIGPGPKWIPFDVGRTIRTSLRLMSAEDEMVTTMYLRGELRTLAIRQAFDEQMNPGTREFSERVAYLQDHPTPALEAAAEAAATRMTFNAPLGEKGAALQKFVRTWNLQWMIPFIRTPINIAKELLRMSPFAPVVGEWRQAMAKGGVERDRAISEMALGTGITALTMAYAFSGDITGGGSADPGKNRAKQGVWQPYSIKIGNTWYDYSRIQPTGTLMGMAADIAEVWDHMNDDEKDQVPKMLASAFAQAITNQTFLQGITNFVNAVSDPARFGPRFMQGFASSMVPNVIGQPTMMADPAVRQVNSMIEAVQSRIPGLREQLLPKRDWLGEVVPAKERTGIIMPVREQPISDDKVRQEADRLDLSVGGPPKKTHIGRGTGKIGDVEFTPEEQDKFTKAAGDMAHPILTNIVNAPGYDQIPDIIKRRIFTNVLTASHKFAAAMALPADKKLAYIQQISERMTQELQPTE